MNYLQTLWAKIPAKWQLEIASAWHTFITAAILELGVEFTANQSAITTGDITKDALLAIGAAVIRSGVKAVFQMAYDSAKAKQVDAAQTEANKEP